jgi:hypothetical protein
MLILPELTHNQCVYIFTGVNGRGRTGNPLNSYTYDIYAYYALKAFNLLKPKLIYVVLKNSVRTSKRTPHFTISTINLLKLF